MLRTMLLASFVMRASHANAPDASAQLGVAAPSIAPTAENGDWAEPAAKSRARGLAEVVVRALDDAFREYVQQRMSSLHAAPMSDEPQRATQLSRPEAPSASLRSEVAEIANIREASQDAIDHWQTRDKKLVAVTAAMGVTWGVGAIASTALGVRLRQQSFKWQDTPSNDARSIRPLAISTYVVSAITGAAFVGLLVSGISLGLHRSRGRDVLAAVPEWLRHTPEGFAIAF